MGKLFLKNQVVPEVEIVSLRYVGILEIEIFMIFFRQQQHHIILLLVVGDGQILMGIIFGFIVLFILWST